MRPGRVGQVHEVAELAEAPVGRVLVVGDEAGGDEVGLGRTTCGRRPRARSPPARPRRRAGRTTPARCARRRTPRRRRRRRRRGRRTASSEHARRAVQWSPEARDREPAVARLVQAVERTEAGLLLVGARPLRPAVGTDPRVGVEVHAAVHDRRVDELTLAGALAPVERHEHRERRLHRARLVAHPEAVPVGAVALAAELLLEPARRLRELVEARATSRAGRRCPTSSCGSR